MLVCSSVLPLHLHLKLLEQVLELLSAVAVLPLEEEEKKKQGVQLLLFLMLTVLLLFICQKEKNCWRCYADCLLLENQLVPPLHRINTHCISNRNNLGVENLTWKILWSLQQSCSETIHFCHSVLLQRANEQKDNKRIRQKNPSTIHLDLLWLCKWYHSLWWWVQLVLVHHSHTEPSPSFCLLPSICYSAEEQRNEYFSKDFCPFSFVYFF